MNPSPGGASLFSSPLAARVLCIGVSAFSLISLLQPASALASDRKCKPQFQSAIQANSAVRTLRARKRFAEYRVRVIERDLQPLQSAFNRRLKQLANLRALERDAQSALATLLAEERSYTSPELLQASIEAEHRRLQTEARTGLDATEASAASSGLSVCSKNPLCLTHKPLRDSIQESIALVVEREKLSLMPEALLKPAEVLKVRARLKEIEASLANLEASSAQIAAEAPLLLCNRAAACLQDSASRALLDSNITTLNRYEAELPSLLERARKTLAARFRSLKSRKQRAQSAAHASSKQAERGQSTVNALAQKLTEKRERLEPFANFLTQYPTLYLNALDALRAAKLRRDICTGKIQ
jgi:hypothetical protein